MSDTKFVPHHVSATPGDLAGNNGTGRYILLPGSDGRARRIAENFDDVRVLESPRSHNLYLGTLRHKGRTVDVASVCSGMGTPSLDIIVNELFKLGGRRFLRVGTAGSLQPERIRVGDLIVATAAVRDENTSRLYVPVEYPAVASLEMVEAARRGAANLALEDRVFFGIVHSKDSLFAREFGEGPLSESNRAYMKLLEDSGVVASEMEASHLFILASLFTHQLRQARESPDTVLAGAILSTIGDDGPFAPKDEAAAAVNDGVALALETIKELALLELADKTDDTS